MTHIVAIIATIASGFVANYATDVVYPCRYHRYMSKKRSYSTPPVRPINQWVREALDHGELSNAEIGRLFYERGIIGTEDRSLAGKMATFRDVSAEEMLLLSELTGYAPPIDAPEVEAKPSAATNSEAQLRSALLAYGVDARQLKRLIEIIKTFTKKTSGEQSEQTLPDDQSQRASHRHAKLP